MRFSFINDFKLKELIVLEKFEYYTYDYDTKCDLNAHIYSDIIQTKLNQLGRDGWELVSFVAVNQFRGATSNILYHFKRKL